MLSAVTREHHWYVKMHVHMEKQILANNDANEQLKNNQNIYIYIYIYIYDQMNSKLNYTKTMALNHNHP